MWRNCASNCARVQFPTLASRAQSRKPSIFQGIGGGFLLSSWPIDCPENIWQFTTPPVLPTRVREHDSSQIESSTRRPLTMPWLRRVFRLPANESNIGLVLILCIISMSCMSIALVWQAQIIANQREAIQWLERLKFGG